MDLQDGLSAQLAALMTGLADQKIKNGAVFMYDGGRLFASDVSEIALPCALVLADSLSRQLGMGGCGYEFELGKPNPVFPVHPIAVTQRPFFEVAPYVTEVFESTIYQLRNDLTQVYALAVNRMGLVLADGVPAAEADVMPVVASAVMENQRALLSTGTLGLGR